MQVYGRGEFDGRLWIAMEYLDGINAAQLIREQFPAGMPAGEALSIVAAIAGHWITRTSEECCTATSHQPTSS
ncbi:serine/threonine-kinase pknF domain protein [Mycobacterium xenopi 3993]|nr:serine/threonine-kinase pknF domain protein [Mycobacterium xenopi 3993]